MKRKKGYKGGPKKGAKNAASIANDLASGPVIVNIEDNISSDQNDDDSMDLEKDVDSLHFVSSKPSNTSIIDTGLAEDKLAGKGGPSRVKVKLKSVRVLEPHKNYSDLQRPSETTRIITLPPKKVNVMSMGQEDSIDVKTSGMQNTFLEKTSKKAGSIKIKSSVGLGVLSEVTQDKNLNKLKAPLKLPVETDLPLSDNEKTADQSVSTNLYHKETKVFYIDPQRNEKDLNDALAVIKKVMKMDAAEPFNAPVNPIALGIPDYFDVIDNPMDFGTICHDLERGLKYMNSEDVYKDVQFIWENCYTYNNKGDYIIDLMKRVKKNFMKYWLAAGLYSDTQGNGSTESTQIGDPVGSSQDKLYPKSKSKLKRPRYGIDSHKSDCLCAVCVVRRRRKERDESQMPVGSAGLPREMKLEARSPMDNQSSKHASSSLGLSQDTDANMEAEEAETEEKLETTDSARSRKQPTAYNEMVLNRNTRTTFDSSRKLHATQNDSRQQSQEDDDENDDTAVEEQALAYDLQQTDNRHRESAEGSRHFNHQVQENHSILPICRSIFSGDCRSLWNGPHSLNRRHVPVRGGLIHAAVASFIKQ